MQTVTTIGLDIATSVFQVHGVDAAGQVVIRRKLKRRYVLAFFQKLPPCLVGMESTSMTAQPAPLRPSRCARQLRHPPARHNRHRSIRQTCAPFLRAMTRKPSCLISCSHWLPEGSLSVLVGGHGAMNPAGKARISNIMPVVRDYSRASRSF
jgi:hypothetical protein